MREAKIIRKEVKTGCVHLAVVIPGCLLLGLELKFSNRFSNLLAALRTERYV